MALYKYQAFLKDGKKIMGTLDAPTEQAIKDHLAKMNAYPISIERVPEQVYTGFQRIKMFFAGSVSLKDKILFTKQLAVLLKAGVPLLQALELLVEQFSGRLRSIVIDIKDGIKEGQSFAEGLQRHPKVFDSIYVQLVRAGEASGKLELILDRLVEYMERREAVIKQVKGALRTPLIQLVVVLLVITGLVAFVVPQLAETVEAMGVPLPASTAFLLGISDFFYSHYIGIIIFLIIALAGFLYWRSTKSGARALDVIKLKLPIIGYFARIGAVVQFTRTLGILLAAGVNLSESLDIVVNIVNNKVLADALNQARDNIIKQGRIADFLKQTNLFPPIAIYLIKTGEQSGQLDAMLLTVAQNYEAELSEYSDNLSALLEPIMQVVVAVIVGFVIMSVMGIMTGAQSGMAQF